MSYKISGTLNESARILVLNESDWSIESNVEKSAGDYEIENLVSGTKTIVAIDGSGEIVCYGNVLPEECTGNAGDRGIFAGGDKGLYSNVIDYITISSLGNANDFGDLITENTDSGATSNGANDRGIFGGGSADTDSIEYITISVLGNATNFGDLTIGRNNLAATSNGTNDRGVFGGGYVSPYSNVIDYVTISTIGNAIDFGDLTISRNNLAVTSNGINNRGVFGGGYDGNYYNTIDYITISSLGNATDFGDLTVARQTSVGAASNGTNNRGVFGGGYVYDGGYNRYNIIEYITISTTGNATDFGDLTVGRDSLAATSNGTNDRGVFGGGYANDYSNVIDYITISTTGNAIDFGALSIARRNLVATSNSLL